MAFPSVLAWGPSPLHPHLGLNGRLKKTWGETVTETKQGLVSERGKLLRFQEV